VTQAQRRLALAGLFAAAALFSALTMLNGIQPNDEGLMLVAADRIAHGQVPYSDFWWFYPPGQPYLLAGLWKLFGPSLLTWRIVRVLANAAVVLLAYLLARRQAPRGLALAAAAIACGAMAFPSGPHPFPIVLALALGALLLIERPGWAGFVCGIAAFWRIEFAGYLAIGIVIAYLIDGRRPWRFVGTTVATALVLYAPVVLSAGIGKSWDLLVKYPATDFSDYQSLPFPFRYHGILNTSSIGGFFTDSSEEILHFYLPLVLVVGLLASFAAFRRRPEFIATAIFAVGCTHYLITRPDIFHVQPLVVLVAILGAWALGGRWAVRGGRVFAAVVAFALVYAGANGLERFVRGLTDDNVPLNLPVADGVRVAKGTDVPLERAVRYVDSRVPAGKPIYVMTARADLVTSGNPLFYVLADRPNPTRYDIAAPGVVTSAPVQREIIGDLRRTRPLVMRWVDPVTEVREPNKAGRSSGVVLLDDYLKANYAQTARFGNYVMLEPR
jgi:hypothetical protein